MPMNLIRRVAAAFHQDGLMKGGGGDATRSEAGSQPERLVGDA